MALLDWKPAYSVGHAGMDAQHRRLVELINELHEALARGAGKESLGPVLKALIDYTRSHFQDEERLMAAARYPRLAEHRAEHQALTAKAVDLQRRFTAGRIGLSVETLHFLRDWLTGHITGSDQHYVTAVQAASAARPAAALADVR